MNGGMDEWMKKRKIAHDKRVYTANGLEVTRDYSCLKYC